MNVKIWDEELILNKRRYSEIFYLECLRECACRGMSISISDRDELEDFLAEVLGLLSFGSQSLDWGDFM